MPTLRILRRSDALHATRQLHEGIKQARNDLTDMNIGQAKRLLEKLSTASAELATKLEDAQEILCEPIGLSTVKR